MTSRTSQGQDMAGGEREGETARTERLSGLRRTRNRAPGEDEPGPAQRDVTVDFRAGRCKQEICRHRVGSHGEGRADLPEVPGEELS